MAAAMSDGDVAPAVHEQLAAMVRRYREAAGATADLAAAELRLAASTSVLLLALGIAIALFGATAWLLAMLALAALIAAAPAWPLALLAVAAANLVAALASWVWIRSLTPNLTFRELRAALAGRTTDRPPAAPAGPA